MLRARPNRRRVGAGGFGSAAEDEDLLGAFGQDVEVDGLVVAELVEAGEIALEDRPVHLPRLRVDAALEEARVHAGRRFDADLLDDGVDTRVALPLEERRVLGLGDAEARERLAHRVRRLEALRRGLRELLEVQRRDLFEVRRDEDVAVLRERRDLLLDVEPGQETRGLAGDREEARDLVALLERRRDVDRDHDVGAHLTDDVDGHVVHRAAVREELPVPFDRVEEPGDRHARPDGPRELPLREHDLPARHDVRRDAAEGDPEPVEVPDVRRRKRQAPEEVVELLPGDEALREDELSLVEPELGLDEVELVVLLLAVRLVLAPLGVVQRIVPVRRREDLVHFLGRHAGGVERRDDRADARARDVVDGDAQLLEDLEDADVRAAAGSAAREGDADLRAVGAAPERPGRGRAGRERPRGRPLRRHGLSCRSAPLLGEQVADFLEVQLLL